VSVSSDFIDAKARVLAALKQAAPKPLSTWELIHLAQHSRAAGRIWELIHEDGYQIEHTHEGRKHLWRYVADPGPRPQSLFEGRV
jgi:hypothetical protein